MNKSKYCIAFIFVCFLVILSFGIYSCKTESPEPAPDTRTKTQLITDSEWKMIVSTCNVPVDTDGQNGASTDLLSQMLLCEKDDTYLFKADSTTFEKTNIKCKTNEPAAWKGSWTFSADEKTLNWNGEVYSILELSGGALRIKYDYKVGTNTYQITDTYSH